MPKTVGDERWACPFSLPSFCSPITAGWLGYVHLSQALSFSLEWSVDAQRDRLCLELWGGKQGRVRCVVWQSRGQGCWHHPRKEVVGRGRKMGQSSWAGEMEIPASLMSSLSEGSETFSPNKNNTTYLPASIYLCWQRNLFIHDHTSLPGSRGCAPPLPRWSHVTSLTVLWQMLVSLPWRLRTEAQRVTCLPWCDSRKVAGMDSDLCGFTQGPTAHLYIVTLESLETITTNTQTPKPPFLFTSLVWCLILGTRQPWLE